MEIVKEETVSSKGSVTSSEPIKAPETTKETLPDQSIKEKVEKKEKDGSFSENVTSQSITNRLPIRVLGIDYAKKFTANGTAKITGDTATLTEAVDWQVGNTILNTKIDPTEWFQMKGKVNLGSKGSKQGGEDGVSFILHPGDVKIGQYKGEITWELLNTPA